MAQLRDGITPAMLLNDADYSLLRERFLADCKAKKVKIDNPNTRKREAKKWLERNNLRYIKAV